MDLATAEQHLSDALTAYVNARNAASVSHGERSVNYPPVAEARRQVQYWQRVVNDLKALQAGNTNPGIRTAKWS